MTAIRRSGPGLSRTLDAGMLGAFLTAWLVLTGCVQHPPLPLLPNQRASALEARSLADPGLKAFLQAQGALNSLEWPLREWTVDQLVLAALYFQPALEVARAEWRVAQAGRITAGARPNPAISVGPGYNLTPESGISPWLAFVDMDVPIETAGKRTHRMERACQEEQAARLRILEAAWQVRGRVRTAWIEGAFAAKRVQVLCQQITDLEAAQRLMRQKIQAGAASTLEAQHQTILLQKARLELAEAQRQQAQSRADLAAALGVPLRALEAISVAPPATALPASVEQLSSPQVRMAALTNRADLRAALADYEAAQAALQLEVARQYPDVKLGPGYEYDQGDNKIGLRLGLDLPILNRNEGPIAEALARRELAAARFVEAQSRAMAEMDAALAAWRLANNHVQAASALARELAAQRLRIEAMLRSGDAEALDERQAAIEERAAVLLALDAENHRWQALNRLEAAMQSTFAVPKELLENAPASTPASLP